MLVGVVVIVVIIAAAYLGIVLYSYEFGHNLSTTIFCCGISHQSNSTSSKESSSSNTYCATGVMPCKHINENGSLLMSVEYYYFDQNTTKTLDFSNGSQLTIYGYIEPSNGQGVVNVFNAASNFTVTSSIDNVTFGGKDDLSEGIIVNYTITPLKGINGTYVVNLGYSYPSMEECVGDFDLVIGDGVPNLGIVPSFAGCIAMTSSQGPVQDQLFAKIVSTSNDTSTTS